jgi:RNA polymerase-binding transcription factor DksA
MIDTEFFKAQLQEDLAVITKELEGLGILNPHLKQDWIAVEDDIPTDTSDQDIMADRAEAWEERQATLIALEVQYNDINRALHKIENGTYGTCEICGGPIEDDRIAANASARTCTEHMDDEQDLPQ